MSDIYIKDIQRVYQSLLTWSETDNQLEVQDISLALSQLTHIDNSSGRMLAELACCYIPCLRELIVKYWEIRSLTDPRYPEIYRCIHHSLSTTLTKETSRINGMLMTAWSDSKNLVPEPQMKTALTSTEASLKNILTSTLASFNKLKQELIDMNPL